MVRDAGGGGQPVRSDAVRTRGFDRRHARGDESVPGEAKSGIQGLVRARPSGRADAMATIESTGSASGLRFAMVVSKYHDFVTDRLQRGAFSALSAAGVLP